MTETIVEQIQQVKLNITQYCKESKRLPEDIRLLAVSKTHPSSKIQDAYAGGITEFAESYLQEGLKKIQDCQHLPITWHFIGPIQSNKTRLIAQYFDWVQSVDREKILIRLNQQRPANAKPLQVCIQVNLFNEPQKKGVALNQLADLLAIANELPHISLRGLMVIPPQQMSFDKQQQQFAEVAKVYSQFKQEFSSMDTLSMGMSSDMHAAIISGSTMVRVGTGIFGVRGKNHL